MEIGTALSFILTCIAFWWVYNRVDRAVKALEKMAANSGRYGNGWTPNAE